MPKLLNPMLFSSEESKKLFDFFEAQSKLGIFVWKKGKVYSFADKSRFQFMHDVIQRKRKEGKSGVRYEFISDKVLGNGLFGTVYEIAGTLAIKSDFIYYKQAGYKDKTRAIKVQIHDPKAFVGRSISEYQLAKAASHLAVKEPTIQDRMSYSVMKKVKGRELFDIVNDDLLGTKILTFRQRVDLSKMLLHALKSQVTDKGIIHRDLKCENIFVDLAYPITVNIIDFGLSILVGMDDGMDVGTPGFMAPELYDNLEQTVKVDVFSMGRVLALIWHVDLKFYENTTAISDAYNARNVNLSSLFTGLLDVSLENRKLIRNTLQGMMCRDAKARSSVDDAIAAFNQVVIQEAAITKSYWFFDRTRPSSKDEEAKEFSLWSLLSYGIM